jgi:hypothetical protein
MAKKKRSSLTIQPSPRNALKRFSEFCNRYKKFACVLIQHNVLTGYQFGAPVFTRNALDLAASERKQFLNNIVAVERTLYTGLRSRYLLTLPKQREQLLRGLAYGFTHNDLRISQDSLQECIDHENFEIMDCSYYELRSGIWKPVSNRLADYFCGVEDKGRWRETLYMPASVHGTYARGFIRGLVRKGISRVSVRGNDVRIPRWLLLIVDENPKLFEDNVIDFKLPGAVRSISKILSDLLGCKIPNRERIKRVAVPAYIWPTGDPKKPKKIIHSQWAEG